MSQWILALILLVIAVTGIVILVFYLYGHFSSQQNISGHSDIWKHFLKNLRQMQQRGKNIGLVVCGSSKKRDLLERVDQRLLPCVEYVLDNISQTNAIRHTQVNTKRDKMPPNCHVLAIFTPDVEEDKFIIKVTYYTTNTAGQCSSEPLRYRPDVLKMTYTEWNQLNKRDALRSSFRRYFPSFIAAVARKMD